MKTIKNILILNLFITLFVQGESLSQVIQQTIKNDSQIKSSIENYKSALLALEEAEIKYWNQTLDFSIEGGQEKALTPGNLQRADFEWEYQAMLIGKVNLFDGFKRRNKVSEKFYAVELAKNKIFQKVNTISSQIIQVYIDLKRKEKQVEIAKKNVKLHEVTREKVEKRLSGGIGYESEKYQTESRLNLAKTNKLIADKDLKLAEINYKRYIGELPVLSSFENLENSIDTLLPETDLIAEAKENNFDIQMKKSEKKISQFTYKQEEAKTQWYDSTIDVELSTSQNNNVYGALGDGHSYKAVVVLNKNIYNGGADRVSQLRALSQYKMNEHNLNDMTLTIKEQIELGYMKYTMLGTQLKLIDEQIINLEETKFLYNKEYENNKRTIVDVLNIEQEYNYADAQRSNIKYQQLQTYYQLKAVSGMLLKDFALLDIIADIFERKEISSSSVPTIDNNLTILVNALDNKSIDINNTTFIKFDINATELKIR